VIFFSDEEFEAGVGRIIVMGFQSFYFDYAIGDISTYGFEVIDEDNLQIGF